MKNIQLVSTLVTVLAIAASGCGPTSGARYNSSSSKTNSTSNYIFDPSTGDSNPDPTPSASPSPTPTGTAALYTFSIHGVGYTSQSVTVNAGSVLKLKFAPGQQDSTVSGTGYTPVYSMLGVYITVGSSTQSTPMMSNGLYHPAQNSGTMDFSSAAAASTGCTSGTSCRGTVTVTISKPNYDYWCLQFYAYCPWNHVSDTHPWNGTLTIQTDDTVGL